MQLFSFGHPCEHQLRRTCIGGLSCPLNGYPDSWCCSFIKGKINFKRDKPCEGVRCRWGFTHPTQLQFDAVTQVLNESRIIASKIDDGDEKEILVFSIDSHHVADTVQCAMQMMHNQPSSCAPRVGQLLAYAALRAGEPKVFMQLLKTMKKPVDGYLLGAYDYLIRGIVPQPISSGSNNGNGSNGNSNNNSTQGKNAGKKGNNASSNSNNANEKKEDVSEELKNDMVDLMNAALSSGGQLVNREDQHTLQAVFIQSLKGYPKSNKKRQEMLELAIAKFGSRPGPRSVQAVQGAGATGPSAPSSNNISANGSMNNNVSRHGGASSGPTPVAQGVAATATTTSMTSTTAAVSTNAGGRQVARAIEAAQEDGSVQQHQSNSSSVLASSRRSQVSPGTTSNPSSAQRAKDSNLSTMVTASSNNSAAGVPAQIVKAQQPIVGISQLAQMAKQVHLDTTIQSARTCRCQALPFLADFLPSLLSPQLGLCLV
ncbi:hypothetical protein ERJ75_000748700 [Trypanosoma vivax]|nr:hypothetical protein ERJ75_000748700 [Trypanosoma vivax]